VRSTSRIATMLIVTALPALVAMARANAQGPMDMDSSVMMDGSGSACGCRSSQQPPWHGSVNGTVCAPACHHCGVFHADPRGQLHAKHDIRRHGCVTLPPIFPRLHTLCAEGYMPTPPPLALPRCHQCGAVIEGGF